MFTEYLLEWHQVILCILGIVISVMIIVCQQYHSAYIEVDERNTRLHKQYEDVCKMFRAHNEEQDINRTKIKELKSQIEVAING